MRRCMSRRAFLAWLARRKKGERQPSLAERLSEPTTVWERQTVRWYGGVLREVELASGTAVWYHSAKPVVPLRWVLIRDVLGEFEPQALLSTDQQVLAAQIVEWFVLRWQVRSHSRRRVHIWA